jgi:threonine dehydrogenase-like Zn-dependent dehydrogenase
VAKQVIIHAPFDIRLDGVPDADRPLGPYELRCQTELSALSPGTETRIYTGLEADRFAYRVSYPFTTGYNNVSRITEVGSAVKEYCIGQRIFSRMPHVSEFIAAERAVDGAGLRPTANVPPSYDVIAPVPDEVPSEQAAFTHLFTLGFNALVRGQYRFGENVVVIGLGVVGLGAVCMAAAAGARVAAVGNAEVRLDAARALGADEAWLAGDKAVGQAVAFGGEAGIDLVIVCADAWSATRAAIDMSRRHTRIAFLSFPGVGQGPAPFDPFEPGDFYNKSTSYIAVSWMPSGNEPPEYQRFTSPRIYRYILDRMARGRIDLSPLVTHHLPIARVKEGFDLVVNKDRSAMGIVFDWI